MSRIEKLIQKIHSKPIPSDITFEEIEKVANHYGCIVRKSGGRHSFKVVHIASGTVIPIPTHGKTVKEVYVNEFVKIIDNIEKEG